MGSLNKAMIIGRLGKDPEVRYTQGGQAVASFSVATDHKWTNKNGEKQEKTEWHRIKAWGKLAELAGEYLSKGRQVYVEGRIETSEDTDKEGVKKVLDRDQRPGDPVPGFQGRRRRGRQRPRWQRRRRRRRPSWRQRPSVGRRQWRKRRRQQRGRFLARQLRAAAGRRHPVLIEASNCKRPPEWAAFSFRDRCPQALKLPKMPASHVTYHFKSFSFQCSVIVLVCSVPWSLR